MAGKEPTEMPGHFGDKQRAIDSLVYVITSLDVLQTQDDITETTCKLLQGNVLEVLMFIRGLNA